jgi:hypothetical protein
MLIKGDVEGGVKIFTRREKDECVEADNLK